MELVLTGGSFYNNNEFYFVTRKNNRNNIPSFGTVYNSELTVYQVLSDSIQKIVNLNQTFPAVDICPFTFINLNGNYVHAFAMPNNIISEFRIVEFDSSGGEIFSSDTLFASIIKGIIQNPEDSTYLILFGDHTSYKLNKNLQIIGNHSFLHEKNTNRSFTLPYFQSKIRENKLASGVLEANATGDSVCIANMRFINDSTVVSNWKKLVVYDPLNPNFNDNAFANQRNSGAFQNQHFFAYDRKLCFPGNPTCYSMFKVIKFDTLNNTIWEREFGGDAGYMVYQVYALRDSSCTVIVQRTASGETNYDVYYVHIDKNGNVTNNFLPLLGGEELSIPVKEIFSVYPNPTSDLLTLDNLQLATKAKYISIFDFNGKIVFHQTFEKTISISTLSQGTYVYRIEDQHGKCYDTKFVKK